MYSQKFSTWLKQLCPYGDAIQTLSYLLIILLIALNKMHTLENYITSLYIWHVSEAGNYNEVLLTNAFLGSRPRVTVIYWNLMLAWWQSGIGTRMAWKQFCMFFTFMFFTLGTSFRVMLFGKRKHGRPIALHFGATVENNFPHWNGMPSSWLESTCAHWMDDL